MAEYIYIDASTGSWGSAHSLYIVDYESLPDTAKEMLDGSDHDISEVAYTHGHIMDTRTHGHTPTGAHEGEN